MTKPVEEDIAVAYRKHSEIDWREPFITKDQLANHLGFSKRWVEHRVAEGMPHFRVGGRLRFQVSTAIGWLSEQEGFNYGGK